MHDKIRNEIIEECAKLCDTLRRKDYSTENEDWVAGASDCAAAIRALARLDFSTAGTSHIQEARAALSKGGSRSSEWNVIVHIKKEIAAHIIDLCEGKISDKHNVNDTDEMTIAKVIFELLMTAEKRFGII